MKTSRSTLCGETTAVCLETPSTEHTLILLEKSEAFWAPSQREQTTNLAYPGLRGTHNLCAFAYILST